MGNMSYCRFQNTLGDLEDCFDHLLDKDLSLEEMDARKELIEKEYLLIEKGRNLDTYFVGKRAVREWKYPADEDELVEE